MTRKGRQARQKPRPEVREQYLDSDEEDAILGCSGKPAPVIEIPEVDSQTEEALK